MVLYLNSFSLLNKTSNPKIQYMRTASCYIENFISFCLFYFSSLFECYVPYKDHLLFKYVLAAAAHA